MTQRLVIRKLLTIICEAGLEQQLTDCISAAGASGYTITDARGKGAHGLRDASWSDKANIRIEVLCDEPIASSLLDKLINDYYQNYTLVTFVSDVGVLRAAKFAKADL